MAEAKVSRHSQVLEPIGGAQIIEHPMIFPLRNLAFSDKDELNWEPCQQWHGFVGESAYG